MRTEKGFDDVLAELRERRLALETEIQEQRSELSELQIEEYEARYERLQKDLAREFGRHDDDTARISLMLEVIRLLENELVQVHNFVVDPTIDRRELATRVERFIEELENAGSDTLSPLERTYFRGIAALWAGDSQKARAALEAACESEEPDEANDIKYKSFVILGNFSHEEADYERAHDLHDRSMRYSSNDNVMAQAIALKGLNSYALRQLDEALSLFERALGLFDDDAPFYNPYFHRNALLFCGLIHFDRKEYDRAAVYYHRVLEHALAGSFDAFDALTKLGKIHFHGGRFAEATDSFQRAIEQQGGGDSEVLVDTWFWLAKAHLRNGQTEEARGWLRKVVASGVRSERKAQAAQLLERVG